MTLAFPSGALLWGILWGVNASMMPMAYANHLIHPPQFHDCLAMLWSYTILFCNTLIFVTYHFDTSPSILNYPTQTSTENKIIYCKQKTSSWTTPGCLCIMWTFWASPATNRVQVFVRKISVFTNMFQLSYNPHQLKFETWEQTIPSWTTTTSNKDHPIYKKILNEKKDKLFKPSFGPICF